mgnify:CR=1 FL=1
MACCKIHKETCSFTNHTYEKVSELKTDSGSTASPSLNSNDKLQPSDNFQPSLEDKLSSSERLKSFLASSPYLVNHLPVLLARINRHDTFSSSFSSEAQLAKELNKKERIVEVLKEAIETDPKVAELYQILIEENIL